MTPTALVLVEAERRLLKRCLELGVRLDEGQDVWPAYLATLTVLQALIPDERRPLATTKDLATRYGVTPKTILKRSKRGELRERREQHGRRGTGAIRWRSA